MLFHTATDEELWKDQCDLCQVTVLCSQRHLMYDALCPLSLLFPTQRYLSEQCLIWQLHSIFTSELWFCMSRCWAVFSLMCISVFHFFRCWQQYASSSISACREGGAFQISSEYYVDGKWGRTVILVLSCYMCVF